MNLVSADGRGGADKLAFDMSRGLQRRGHKVIWGSPSNNIFLDKARESDIDIYRLDLKDDKDMSPLRDFLRFCNAAQVDIVNAHHSPGRHFLIFAKFLGLKSKVVFTRHCIAASIPLVGMFFYNFFVDANIAVSQVVRKSLLRGGILPGKVSTVYGGVNIDSFQNVKEEKVEGYRKRFARRGAFNIGIVARLGLHKGYRTDKPTMKRHEVLFRALAEIKEDFNLLVLGADGKYLEIIANDNGLDPAKIIFCGFQDDIAPFYKIMDLNVLPSPSEGLGLAIIEAMAAGVPCIGADSGGIKEIITDGENGLLFRPGDYRELAEKIRVPMANRALREKFIANGEETVRKHFAIDKTVDNIERAFYALMNH